MKVRYVLPCLLVALYSTLAPAAADVWWSCDYSSFRGDGKDQGYFHVIGDQLEEASGDVILDFKLLEDSEKAIVAAKGGSYASGPAIMGFLVMINKKTGEFILTTSSTGSVNGRQTGNCVRVDHRPW